MFIYVFLFIICMLYVRVSFILFVIVGFFIVLMMGLENFMWDVFMIGIGGCFVFIGIVIFFLNFFLYVVLLILDKYFRLLLV